jgi:hypothetical protein
MHHFFLRTLPLLALGLAATTTTTAAASQPGVDTTNTGSAEEAADVAATTEPESDHAVAATADPEPVPTPTATAVVVVKRTPDIGRIRHRHRLHIDTDLFAWRRWKEWGDDGNPDNNRLDSLSILGGVPLFGVPGGIVGPVGNVKAGYAYGLTDRVVLGVRLGLGWQRLSASGDEGSAGVFSAAVVPYFEYVFRPGHAVRPYLGARVGVGGSTITGTSGDMNNNGDSTSTVGTIGPTMGASAGLHAFITERVSLDPALTFDYQLIYARSKAGGMSTDFEKQAQSPNVALALGLSVWLGRDRDDDRDEARRRARERRTASR